MAPLPHAPPEALIAVLSAFGTNIYIAHVRTNPHMQISVLRNTDFSLTPSPPATHHHHHQPSGDPGKLRSIWLIMGGKKREGERERGGKGEGGEAASSVSSEIGGARVTKALFFCRDRETKE